MRATVVFCVITGFIIGIWIAPVSIAAQFERRVTIVAVVALSIVWFAAGYIVGKTRRQDEPLQRTMDGWYQ